MTNLVAYSPEYWTFDQRGENAADVVDAWSLAAINAQGATGSTLALGTWITEPSALLIYETQFRLPKRAANLISQAPDALGSSPDRHVNDALLNVEPDFLLRRTVPPPVARPKGNTDAVIAEWQGYVTRISDQTIEARLAGLTGEGVAGEAEEATIPRSEVTKADQSLLAVGALFRLCISYEKTPAGERRRYSTLVFRRLPAYRQQDLDDAHERTRARVDGLRLD